MSAIQARMGSGPNDLPALFQQVPGLGVGTNPTTDTTGAATQAAPGGTDGVQNYIRQNGTMAGSAGANRLQVGFEDLNLTIRDQQGSPVIQAKVPPKRRIVREAGWMA
jgi:hypothetical protein